MLIGVASPELMAVFFGENAWMHSPSRMRREAKERSDKLLGRDKKPVEEVSEEEVLKALGDLERRDR